MHWRTMDEMKNAPFSSSCPQRLFEAVGRSESTIGFQRSNIFQPSNIFQDSTSSNALHMTLLHPPPPPFCKQQRNCQRSNIFQPSNIFQDSTSSNALHMTLLHPPPPPPPPHPPPPSVYKNDLSGLASRLRVPRSSGEPPALSLYIYIIKFNFYVVFSKSCVGFSVLLPFQLLDLGSLRPNCGAKGRMQTSPWSLGMGSSHTVIEGKFNGNSRILKWRYCTI